MKNISPTTFYFQDDGAIPNSSFPTLLYPSVFDIKSIDLGNTIEKHFRNNSWHNSWRAGIYPFHHYHSTTHEVLGCYRGHAILQMGGKNGVKLSFHSGDVIVIPAGVGHKCISKSNDFVVVGAYDKGRDWDLLKGKPEERPFADHNIDRVPLPKSDPYLGKSGGVPVLWLA